MGRLAARVLFPKLLSTTPGVSSCMHITSRMASNIQKKTDNGDDISLRALKKKRGRALYQKKHKIAKATPLDHERTNETEYYFENGLRKVYPYYYNFSTYVKGRWYGRTILDVFTKEFKSETEEKYRETIENGRLTVNGKKVPTDFVLADNQLLEHTCHRHENPVVATPIEIVADTAQVLVINKPSSIPCHPCGRYRYNSLTFILDKEYGYKHLRTLYRLDRLTSGVLIFPKTTEASKRLEKQLLQRQLQKEYICRVVGLFPEGEVECREPLGVLSHKLSIYGVVPGGKESHTTFTRVSYNGTTSVVKCIPHTGRTHQIRLHLQFLGHPIVNDPLYNNTAFGPQKGKGGIVDCPLEQIEEHVMKTHNTGMWKIGDNPLYARRMALKMEQSINTSPDPLESDTKDINSSCSSLSTKSSSVEIEKNLKETNITNTIDIERDACDNKALSTEPDIKGTSETGDGKNSGMTSTRCIENVDKSVACVGGPLKEIAIAHTELTSEGTDKTSNVEDESTTPPHKRARLEEETKDVLMESHSSSSCNLDAAKTEIHSRSDNRLIPDQSATELNATENVVLTANQSIEGPSSHGSPDIAAKLESNLSDTNEITIDTDSQLKELNASKTVIGTSNTDCTNNSRIALSGIDDGLADVSDGVSSMGDGVPNVDATAHGSLTSRVYQEDKFGIDEYCDGCKYLYFEPKTKDLVMFLHAVRYKGPGWEYSTPLPDWAAEDWHDDSAEK